MDYGLSDSKDHSLLGLHSILDILKKEDLHNRLFIVTKYVLVCASYNYYLRCNKYVSWRESRARQQDMKKVTQEATVQDVHHNGQI